ncbi:hypothetical protein A3K73_09150 [Candidatus Pacearchaeota archaeon RBG_13_36_9]|nr:MAG: hypothetical protein A3K73_09150 [Candidatus Pacearchaeota archaeon RBG_13_36_9]
MISEDLKIYGSYVRVAEAHLAYDLIKDKMRKWIDNILNIFENGMVEKGKDYYVDIVGVLRKRIENRFREIDNLEGALK